MDENLRKVLAEVFAGQNFDMVISGTNDKERMLKVKVRPIKKKNEICAAHNLQIIRVENSYARRYNHIKEILLNYFSVRH